MISATQFAQYLLRLDPQRSNARLALYNYLKHIVEPNEPFTPQTIARFYSLALNFDNWQTNAQSLAQDVRDDLQSFFTHAKIDDPEWRKLRHADEIQVVLLKNSRDFEETVQAQESARRKSGDRFKLIRVSETELLSVFLTALGMLEVKLFAPRAMINGRFIVPLAPIGHLHYSAGLELLPHVRQRLQGSLMTTISFFQDENGLNGMITRGHTFQKFETFVRARGSDNHDLFTSLKRIERYYINPQSDPYYQDLVHALERANHLLHSPQARGLNLQMAEKALQKGQSALRTAFPNDRLLQLLITHLDYGIRQNRDQSVEDAHSPK